MAATFLYARSDDCLGRYGTVTGTTPDTTYSINWLVNGNPATPARKTGGTAAWSISGTAQDVDILCVAHHLLDAALEVAISGDVTATVTIPAYPPNGIPLNGVTVLEATATGVTALTVTVTANSGPVIIGEFIAAKSRSLPGTLMRDTAFTRATFARARPLDRAWVPPYDRGLENRTWTGGLLLTVAQLADLEAWEQSQRAMTRPSLVIPDPTTPVARVGYLTVGQVVHVGQLRKVPIAFVELPRTRW